LKSLAPLQAIGSIFRLSYLPWSIYRYIQIFPPIVRQFSGPRPTQYLDNTHTHHNWQGSSGWMISSSQRPLPDNTQHSQETNIHAPCGIRTCNPSMR
jgi:hypothetical protein